MLLPPLGHMLSSKFSFGNLALELKTEDVPGDRIFVDLPKGIWCVDLPKGIWCGVSMPAP